MIDPDTIEDMDDCDGESLHVYGFDPETKAWTWAWIPLEHLYESGRADIIERLYG